MRHLTLAALAGGALVFAAPVSAQDAPRAVPRTPAQLQARQQIATFEAALEHAVRNGAQMFDQRLQAMTAANMVMLSGLTRARGFRLDDYGVMFDVEFPSMRRSVVWSIQELERRNTSTGKPTLASGPDAAINPREMYQTEITAALLNAILDVKSTMGLTAGEWLTVAARESVVDRRVVASEPGDTPMTVILRIRGGDLQAIHEGRLTREEARTRVEVRHY